MPAPRVVVIGAGFGGLTVAKKLSGKRVDVLIIDRNNYHLFTPLLYQVASSLLNPSDIARPVRALFRGEDNVRFRQATVTAIDFERKYVHVRDSGEDRPPLDREHDIPYDYLVIAAGSTTNYFGLVGAEERALGLKDLPEALELRNHSLRCLETATHESAETSVPWLTFVVVGAGPTGVEYAGALSELVRDAVPREYPELDGRRVRIVLIEGMEEVLPPFPRKLGRAARRVLTEKGIEVITGQRVTVLDGDAVVLANGERIAAKTLVWAAGVKPAELAAAVDVPRSRSGRVEVDDYLRVTGRDGVYAIGDVASFVQDGKEVPMLSAPAMQAARVAAANILAEAGGSRGAARLRLRLKRFHYRDKGTMATIGKNHAVAHVWKLNFTGFIGWVLWLTVHLYYIIGFRNRLSVMMGWAWDYLRGDRPIRIIARARGERATVSRERGPAGP